MEEIVVKKPNLFVESIVSNVYTYYFDEELGEPSDYRELSNILMSAEETDTVNLIINGPGGDVSTAAQLTSLIQNSRATVIGHLVGPSASAYCSIFLACHGWVVHPSSNLMAHTFPGGVYEKGSVIKKSLEAISRLVEDMMLDLYVPFFSIEEVTDMVEHISYF